MKQQRMVIVAAVASGLAIVGGWFALPILQAPAAAVGQQSSVHVERARRLLHQYSPAVAYSSLVNEQLKAADVDVAESIDDIAENGAEDYQAAHGAKWAAYEPTDWPELGDHERQPSPARAKYGELRRQIQDGLSEREDLNSKNTGLLDEAMQEINAALAASCGDASGRTDVEANQLKGVILFQKGLAERTRAQVRRQEADWHRRGLVQLAESAAKNGSGLDIVSASGIDESIAALEGEVATAEARLNERRGELQKLQDQVEGFETRLAAARQRTEDAGYQLEKLKAEGLNFADPAAAQAFAQNVEKLSKEYDDAMREAHVLEVGGYPKAEIDHSGDYVRGHYVEEGRAGDLTIDKGLRHHQTERDVLAAKVSKEAEGLANLQADLDALRQTRKEHEDAQAAAKARIAELAPQAADYYEELNRVNSEAFATEETALQELEQAAKQFEQTARLAEQWAGEARQSAQNLSADARHFSANDKRSNNRWLAGYTLAQAADARLERAWIFFERYRAAAQNAELLGLAGPLALAEADPEAERSKSAEAKNAGVEEIKLAMTALERAHRDTERHWTITAQAAGTTYLLALFGEEDYLADAVEGYRSALKSRENEPYVQKIAQRLKELEGR